MSKLSSPLIEPLRLNRWRLAFHVIGKHDFEALQTGAIKIKPLRQSHDFQFNNFLNVTFESDEEGKVRDRLQYLFNTADVKMDISVEQLDVGEKVCTTWYLSGCRLEELVQSALDYRSGKAHTQKAKFSFSSVKIS